MIMYKINMNKVQHVENDGEYLIPQTRFRVDGYCKETNTIYKFHGNLNLFDPTDRCHPYEPAVTAGDLYKRTMQRENILYQLGYNIKTMWESDYHG